jgi:hypothetical protein
MAEDHWNDSRSAQWERDRRRERLESRQDYGQADYSDDPSYSGRASGPASVGRRFEEPGDDRGYRPFGDTGPIYTASGAYGGEGRPFAPTRRFGTRDDLDRENTSPGYRDFEANQRRRHGGDYDPDRYTPNPREGRGQETRSWWDRTQDELSSWFGDDQARHRRDWDEQRAHTAGEHRGRGPKGYRRSDARVLDDVNDRLADDPHLDASEIEVSVKDAEVTLSGTVFRREDKRRAEDLAERVSGVTHLQNNLRLHKDGGPAVI